MLVASIASVLQPAVLHHFGRVMNWVLIVVVLLVAMIGCLFLTRGTSAL